MKLLKYLALASIISLSAANVVYSESNTSTFLNYKDLEWKKGVGNSETAVLWGDDTDGRYGNLTKLQPGAGIGYHYHSNDLRAVVVKGSVYIRDKNNVKETVLDTGSYFFRKGKEVFEIRCAFDDECVLLFMQTGILDFNFVK